MAEETKKFCLMTVGRAGSTSLMNTIVDLPAVVTPAAVFSNCVDHELLHPRQWRSYARALGRLVGRPITSREQLIEAFFRLRAARFVGFKSMPERHKNFSELVQRGDVQFISLTRQDIASTVASFQLARRSGSWRRAGGEQASLWTFDEGSRKQVLGNVRYVLQSVRLLRAIPGSISLSYEDLCDPGFMNARLDEFFGARVALDDPKPPTSGASYVTNWSEFRAFVDEAVEAFGSSG